MNEDILKGQWKQFVGNIKQQWGKLTDDELTEIDGNREKLVGKLQERYGYTKAQAQDEWNKFAQKQGERVKEAKADLDAAAVDLKAAAHGKDAAQH